MGGLFGIEVRDEKENNVSVGGTEEQHWTKQENNRIREEPVI